MKSYNECTITQYKDIHNILSSEEDAMTKNARLLSYVTNTPLEEMTVSYVKDNIHRINFIKHNDFYPHVKFRFKGRKYKLIYDARKIKAYKYIDVMNTLKTDKEKEAHIIENMEKFMALLADEITRFKTHLTYEEKCEAFKELTMDKVFPVTLFFSKVLIALMPHTLDYLEDQLEKMQTEGTTQTTGGG